MNTLRPFLAGLAALLVVSSAAPARADQADKDACVGLDQGDACTRGDGSPGSCVPDASDPAVLTCEDDAAGAPAGSDTGSDGCSWSGRSSDARSALALAALAALAVVRRGRRRP